MSELSADEIAAVRELSVHLLRIVGLLCESSVHIEILLTKWIYGNHKNYYWECLNHLALEGRKQNEEFSDRFSGLLLPVQKEKLLTICRHIQHLHASPHVDDLKLVGDSLLYSVRELTDYKGFMKKLSYENNRQASSHDRQPYNMVQLSLYGHVLTPAAHSSPPALQYLLPNMVSTIHKIQQMLSRTKMPLVVMQDFEFPFQASERESIIRASERFLGDKKTSRK